MARILEPRDYGLLGLLAIFSSLSTLFIDSGYKDALIRGSNHNTNSAFSAVFTFNVVISIFIYLGLFFSSPFISNYFNEPQLNILARIVFLSLIFNALSIVQTTQLEIKINFKILAKINFITTLLGSVLGITFAIFGFGVWSLVFPGLITSVLRLLFLFYFLKWKPIAPKDLSFLKVNFNFSIKLLITRIFESISTNIIQLLIGKFYTVQAVGFFTKANTFYGIPNNILTSTINEVSYPAFARESPENRYLLMKKMVRFVSMISFPLSIGIIVISKPMIIVLIGEKWSQSIPILQVLSLLISFMALNYINNSITKLAGKVNFLLWTSIVKNSIIVILLFFARNQGIITLCFIYVVVNLLIYLLYAFASGLVTGYKIQQQLKDIIPFFISAIFMGITMHIPSVFITNSFLFLFFLQTGIGLFVIIIIYLIFFKTEFLYVKKIILKNDKSPF